MDNYAFLEKSPPTPPLTQQTLSYQLITDYLEQNVGLGEG